MGWFNVGDEVVITVKHDEYTGDFGQVIGRDGDCYQVEFVDGETYYFDEGELGRVNRDGFPAGVAERGFTAQVDPFDVVINEVAETNRKKRGDYASNGSPWQNFEDSSRQVGAPAGTSVEVLIATKQSRLRNLLTSGREPNNESIRDSLVDRATYSLIAVAMWDAGLYVENP